MGVNQEKVCVVGGGILQCSMIAEAQALGLYVICTDGDQHCPGREIADEFVRLDTYDVSAHWVLGIHYKGDGSMRGVVTCGADVAPSVAAFAAGACLPGIPEHIARRTHNKITVRHVIKNAGMTYYQPWWTTVSRLELGTSLDTVARLFPYPCILKPAEERASRGVCIVENPEALRQAACVPLAYYGPEFLVEGYLRSVPYGTEHSTEMIFGDQGDILWWNIVDRYFDYTSGTPIELGHVNPTQVDEEAQHQIFHMALKAAKALGVTWGPWKIDCLMTQDGPKILECTARLSGGFESQWSSPATDRHPMRTLLQLACGFPADMQPSMDASNGYAAVAAVLPQRSGTLKKMETMKDVDTVMVAKEGDRVAPARHNGERIGYVLTHGETYQETWDMAKRRADTLAEALVET